MSLGEKSVRIAEWQVARQPAQIAVLGLGSCIGISLFDKVAMVGGVAHIMLPDSKQFPNSVNPGKFPDLAVPLLLEEMESLGAKRKRVFAKIAGGAQMFRGYGVNGGIGQLNIVACKDVLAMHKIPLLADETGGSWGRTMILDTGSGHVFIKAANRPLVVI